MRTALFAGLLLLGCTKTAREDVVHVVLVVDDPGVLSRVDEVDAVMLIIETSEGERIETSLPAPAGAFADGSSDFDFAYGGWTGHFDLYASAMVADEGIAFGEAFENPLEPGELEVELEPATNLWTSAEAIDAEDGADGIDPRVALDFRGVVTAVWAAGNDVVGNGGAFGSGWEGAETIRSGSGATKRPRLALDGAGNAFLVWQERDVAESVFGVRRPVDGDWPSPAPELDYDDDEVAVSPDVAVNAGGVAVVTYLQTWYEKLGLGDGRSVWASFYGGGTFPPGEPLDIGLSDPIVESSVGVRPDGRAFVVWQATDGGIWWNHYASGEDPESRPESLVALDASEDATLPRVVADASGPVYAAWVSGGTVHVSREADLSWVDLAMPDVGEGTIEALEIAADVGGVAVAFVRGPEAWAASWDDGWSEVVPLSPSPELDVLPALTLGSGGNGNLAVAFVTSYDGSRTLWATERDDADWSPAAAITNAEEISSPQLALDAGGDALVVWSSRAAGRTRIYASLRGL